MQSWMFIIITPAFSEWIESSCISPYLKKKIKTILEQYKNVKSDQFNASLLNFFQKTILLTPNV